MFDVPSRPADNERVILSQIDFGAPDYAERLEEARLLAQSAGAEICAEIGGRRRRPDPRFFVGKGKAEEIAMTRQQHNAALVIFNHDLSPAQERNLERMLSCRVVDRTRLILDIFALRAQSAEGKLQVELAQLEHLSTRLVRGWTHLERQRGGIGLRGPGEKQLETDRRLLGLRARQLKERLFRLSRQRNVQRQARENTDLLNVSLVGYTNAGKSSLFNALTRANVYSADQLFATLDTTSRRLWLPLEHAAAHEPNGAVSVVISDTIGFIRDLPHTLIAAFHATLEATAKADILLHVIDSANPARDAQIAEVNRVLAEIGVRDIPQILVWNKIDLTSIAPAAEEDVYGKIRRVKLSARTGAGLSFLRSALRDEAAEKRARRKTKQETEVALPD
ncbi:MAG: GTPase HflX [Zoogloeaceae bacterium]|jgi:GTP-binding protein HflX|nr:GTPase HflX [Zoogloeaceae bacterium]